MPQSLQPNPLLEEWKRSKSSLTYGGWLERGLTAARESNRIASIGIQQLLDCGCDSCRKAADKAQAILLGKTKC